MNSRERVITTLNHREPDRVPFDMGGTVVSGIHIKAYQALRHYLGLSDGFPKIVDHFQQIVNVDDDLKDRLDVDVKNISLRSSGTFNINMQETEDYTFFYDEFGIGWRMPKEGGLYYDMFDPPLKGNITIDDVKRFKWPDPLDPKRFEGLKDAAQKVIEFEKRAVIVGSMSAGILEIVAWTRGFEDYFADIKQNEKLFCSMLDKSLELKLAYWGKMLELLGDSIDVVQEADDFAGQDRLLISPTTYRNLVMPRHKILFDFIHSHSHAKIFFHSCGAVRPIIPDLIDVGVDILNPVQVSAKGMGTADLKRDFGKDLVFWGGGVDTQFVLVSGTPNEVRAEVKQRVMDLKPGGGFIFNTVHNIQSDVPPENIMAMWETYREFGLY